MISLQSEFLLKPEVIFLNHGSFGACPRTVFKVYQQWQLELERQPVEFLGRRITNLMAYSRSQLAAFLGAAPEDIVYFPNPTTAINMVARNIKLREGDEVLATNHEYGAMDRTWRFVCHQRSARYINFPIGLPVTDQAAFVEDFWRGVTHKTRVIFISHITSPTALIFPVAEICQRAHQAGILCIVDGAHAIGQIPIDLTAIGADMYTGACHKWLCAPKGAAFLYASKAVQAWLDPLVISWGYESEQPSASQFIDYHEWQGTNDISAYLSVPAAINFQKKHKWSVIQQSCHQLALEARQQINALTKLDTICPDEGGWFAQMCALLLPPVDTDTLKTRLYDEFHIEVPVYKWNGLPILRISIQAYNDQDDIDRLIEALSILLNRKTK